MAAPRPPWRGRRPARRGPQPVPRRRAGRRHAGRLPVRVVRWRHPRRRPVAQAGRPRGAGRGRRHRRAGAGDVAISYLSLVLGELAPKRLGAPARGGLRAGARPDRRPDRQDLPAGDLAAVGLAPTSWCGWSAATRTPRREQMSDEELRELVNAHETLGEEERRIVEDVFEAGDRQIREVMIPRTEVDFLDASHAGVQGRQGGAAPAALALPGDPRVRRRRDRLRARPRPARPRDGQRARCGSASWPGRPWCCRGPARSWPRWRTCAARACTSRSSPTSTAAPPASSPWRTSSRSSSATSRTSTTSTRPRPPCTRGGDVEVDGLLNLDDFEDETGVELPEGPYETVVRAS